MTQNYRELTGKEKLADQKTGHFSLRQLRQGIRLPAA